MSSKTSYHITDSDSELFEENLIKKMAKIVHTHTHTHKPHLRTTSSAHLTCAFHILTIRFCCQPKRIQYTSIYAN